MDDDIEELLGLPVQEKQHHTGFVNTPEMRQHLHQQAEWELRQLLIDTIR